jgi:hypothetical protein
MGPGYVTQHYQIVRPGRQRFISRNVRTPGREQRLGSENKPSASNPARIGAGAAPEARRQQRFGNRHHHVQQEHLPA